KTIGDKTVLEVEVFHGKYCPYYLTSVGKEKSAYVRVNGTSRPADARILKELELMGQRLSYDTMREIGENYDPTAAKQLMDGMYQKALDACGNEAEREEVHPLTLAKLEDFGILCKDGKDYAPTHAYTLLTKPKDRNIKIQCALFKGMERDEFIDKKEFRGAVQDQVEEAYQFVLRHINMGAVIDGLYRHDVYELPTRSIREIIANACLHRSYMDSSSIQVSIYDDRLEVDSPGMLYDGLNITEALSGKSKCRNKAIAEAFQYMKIIEGWGTGLPRLFRQCRERGLPEPKFEEFGDGIKVTIYRRSGSEWVNGTTQSTTQTTQLPDGRKISDVEIRIVDAMKENSKITQSQLAARLGIDINTVKYHVRNLSKNNVIERKGNNRSGEWVVLISDYTKWRQRYFGDVSTEDFQRAAIAYAKDNISPNTDK
ncbi:MAG: winged helix-turn-helix transcriptional regulator, partial [Lachnospiraceae bacterium]|nr:winged helix-turn-helix transcriptional regulator [Lachnospiraceae bacterium]